MTERRGKCVLLSFNQTFGGTFAEAIVADVAVISIENATHHFIVKVKHLIRDFQTQR